ncbi:bifunctional alpha/beta hydrolase/OsmC family protein [Pseudodonghicola flavimaris]|uniref:Alpha/beta fold hydrolase n=1 Tax=Pseudodonghicola flavimaris TaxID=3050036 RepID=A0ABT7F797_9RHOB|nr:alpha/beta fold hydrolase [Pseudodonghicola flavimaris]MDK3020485.1 alpha/beta fold hydrolase [Pseudodonghicola flavimaris]
MPTERITFPGHDGAELAARLDLPEGPHLATAVFAHCFTCSKDIPAARRIAARLAAMGIAVLRFDFTGLGHSEGEFGNTGFSSNVADLRAAVDYLTARGMAPGLLIGHSLGGAAAIRSAPDLPSIKAVVTLGAPHDPEHITHLIRDAMPEIREKGVAQVTLDGRSFSITRSFVEDIEASKLDAALHRMKAALLIMHAPLDDVVGIDNAARLFLAKKHPKSFVTLDTADHMISRPEDAEYAAEVIAAWARRYLALEAPAAPHTAPEGIVRVTEADPAGFLQDVQSGPDHHLLADEPVSVGGSNQGLSPYGLVSAGLGACTSMTIRMYARRKNWPLDGVSVDISHAKVHAQDAGSGSPGKIDRFTRAVRLCGDLDADQRVKLLEIADKCPVHRTLSHGAEVHTELVPEES